MDLPVAVVDVDRVLEQDRELDEAGGVRVVVVEVLEVPLDLRAQPVLPPAWSASRGTRGTYRAWYSVASECSSASHGIAAV